MVAKLIWRQKGDFLSFYNDTIKCELLAEGCDGENNNHKNFAKKATRVTF
jgi:hypothetical protein